MAEADRGCPMSRISELGKRKISRKENNTPEIAMNLFTQNAGNTKIIQASRYNETTVYQVFDKSTETSVDSNFTPGEMKQSHLF